MTTFICTTWASITNTLGLDLRHRFNRKLSEWDALQEDIAVVEQFVTEKVRTRSDDEFLRSSAEINSLVKMGMTADDDVVLIATETIEGNLCAQLVAKLLESKNLCAKVDVEVINGLQARDGKRFRQEGLKNLVNFITRYEYQDVVFNPTGGFKSVVPYITLAGMLFHKPVKYIHEFSDDLITLVNFPLRFDEDLVFQLEEKFVEIEKESFIKRATWEKGLDYNLLQRADSLIEEIDGSITLSGLGLLVWERFKKDYPLGLQRDKTPARIKPLKLDLLEDLRKKAEKDNKVKEAKMIHHGHEVILKEADRLLVSPFVRAILNGCNYNGKTKKTEVNALFKAQVKEHLQVALDAVCMVKLKSDTGFAFLIQTTARTHEENVAIATLLNNKFYN
jgi:putative CRISPR-associated protein (TIGR02619 family)